MVQGSDVEVATAAGQLDGTAGDLFGTHHVAGMLLVDVQDGPRLTSVAPASDGRDDDGFPATTTLLAVAAEQGLLVPGLIPG